MKGPDIMSLSMDSDVCGFEDSWMGVIGSQRKRDMTLAFFCHFDNSPASSVARLAQPISLILASSSASQNYFHDFSYTRTVAASRFTHPHHHVAIASNDTHHSKRSRSLGQLLPLWSCVGLVIELVVVMDWQSVVFFKLLH